ncbi:MAG TPA: phosphodiester glycosidase family protein [Roseiflexaceae bacterium]|nr:phosphodiester glycosidase family protein [Roseiflexaceae bacterium]
MNRILLSPRLRLAAGLWLAMLLLAACVSAEPQGSRPTGAAVVPSLMPTLARPAEPPAPTPTPADFCRTGRPGIELCRRSFRPTPDGPPAELIIARLDPGLVRLRVAYDPDAPQLLSAWTRREEPMLAVNAGFFDERYHSTALLVSDGVPQGQSYQGFGGMLAVAPDGRVELRPLRDQPYDPAEPLIQAVQSFPMLVFPGGQVAPIEEDGARARRSAVALDRSGRLLVIVCASSSFTLRGLAEWLAASDLAIDRALNLDGGASTGLFFDAGETSVAIDSFERVPAVLLVEPAP